MGISEPASGNSVVRSLQSFHHETRGKRDWYDIRKSLHWRIKRDLQADRNAVMWVLQEWLKSGYETVASLAVSFAIEFDLAELRDDLLRYSQDDTLMPNERKQLSKWLTGLKND